MKLSLEEKKLIRNILEATSRLYLENLRFLSEEKKETFGKIMNLLYRFENNGERPKFPY